MSEATQTLKSAIQQAAKTGDQVYSLICKVNSVNEAKRTCDVSPVNEDADILDARLSVTLNSTAGFVLVPAVDSMVIVTFLTRDVGFISLCSELEKILLNCNDIIANDGDNNGLVNVIDLTNRLNQNINILRAAIQAAYTAQAFIDGSAGINAFNAAMASYQNFAPGDYKDDKFTH